MNFHTFKALPVAKKIILGLSILIIALLIFQAGMFVGYMKATFSYRLGNDYRVFDKDMRGPGGFLDKDIPGGHGAFGKIIRINLPTFVIATPDNTEKIIRIEDDTLIRKFRDAVKQEDLALDDETVILGFPNDNSEIIAKFIRIMPKPSEIDQARQDADISFPPLP